jgi:hypothetical protein
MLLQETVGRCPTPCPPFEKGGAKTFISASPGGRLGLVVDDLAFFNLNLILVLLTFKSFGLL